MLGSRNRLLFAAAGRAVWAAAVLIAMQPQARAEDLCLECHLQEADAELRLPAEQVPQSAHRHPSIGCVGCHGGDSSDPTARAHAPDAGYVGRPEADRIAALCGGCHGDARFVRRLNAELPIDQLVLYGASRHGELAASADAEAPVCTTCHGYHDVLAASDPRSPVHPSRVAEQCGGCHADAARMAAYQSPTTQLAQWQRSAHAEALRRGTPRAPTCTGCHGSHGEMPAEVASVARACASCHAEQLDHFQRSAHAKPFRQQGFAECVPCHGTHDVPAALPFELAFGPDGSCNTCHAGDEEINRTIQRLAAMLQGASARAHAARTRAEQAGRAGLVLPQATAALAELHTAETRLKPVVHTFDESALAKPLDEVDQAAQRVDEMVDRARRESRIELGSALGGAGLLGLLFVLLVVKAIRLGRRRRA